MEKKTLNLNFEELDYQQGDTAVCLMPCPCSSSPSYPSTTYQGVGGWDCVKSAAKAAISILGPQPLNDNENCMVAINAFCNENQISQENCQALQAEACAGGGGK